MTIDQRHEVEARSILRAHGERAIHVASEPVKSAAMQEDLVNLRHWQSVVVALKGIINEFGKPG